MMSDLFTFIMSWCIKMFVISTLVIGAKVLSLPTPEPLIASPLEDVVFKVNGTTMSEATWGVRDGNTYDLNPKLIKVLNPGGVLLDSKLDSTSYAGRVSFVGNLTKGQAWFKIINLNINDTNEYLMNILLMEDKSGYKNIPIKLTVVQRATTAYPFTTSSRPTGSTAQRPTSAPPTNPQILKNLTTTLKIEKEFLKDMADNSSAAFKDFATTFEKGITNAYKGKEKYKSVKVVQLRKGSILVTFIVFFKSELSHKDACAPLENAIKDGKLGDLQIVIGSLECSKPKQSSPSPPDARTGVHPGIIAGVAVVGVLAIAGLVIAILFVCRKKSSRKDYRSSTSGQGYEMDAKHGEPEEQYASVQRPASGTKQSNKQQLPQYAVVDKSKKTKKKTREPSDELVYADLDHGDTNASIGTRPPSQPLPVSGSGTVYADIRESGKKKQPYPPPQYGNIQDISYA